MEIVLERDKVCQFPLRFGAYAGQDGWNWPAPPCWGPLVGHEPLKRSHGADPCDPSQVVLLCVGHNSWVEDYPVARKLLGL